MAAWLQQQGADIAAIDFKQSDTDAGRYGAYATDAIRQRVARSFWGTVAGWAGAGRNAAVTVASFPLSSTLTAATLARHPQQGPILQQLLELGVADGRDVVMLHLAVERHRLRERGPGTGGELAWLALLPTSFGTTLFFSELDMQWLRGTTLYTATRLRRDSLRGAWEKLEPSARQLAQASGLQAAPGLDDWLWANSVFWSRAIAFPSPTPDGGSSVAIQEGIVPGLDFCNHAVDSPCKWRMLGAAQAPAIQTCGEAQGAISLVCPRRGAPAPGAELTIDYGNKGNEELLFLYGFALPGNNESEVLTLMLPLPPAREWDEQLLARIALLQRRGLLPQVHLPAADLVRLSSGGGAVAAGGGGTGGGLGTGLPEGVVETLEVFLLPQQQVQQQLQVGSLASGAGGGADVGGSATEQERSGLRLAVLTTLVRLLELKAAEMESPEAGTGPLEQDEQLLAAAGAALTLNQTHCLLYRIGQKRLGRAYLAHAKRLLQQEMATLQKQQRAAQ